MHDLRLALRGLRASPVISTVAVLSLALGIGANTAIFSLVNGLMLRPLPVAEPQRLAVLAFTGRSNTWMWTYAIWEAIRDRAPSAFDGTAVWSTERFSLSQRGEMQPVDGMYVNGDYFKTLGVTPLLGRTIAAEDDVRNGGKDGAVAVVSYGFWQRRYGGAATAVGSRLTLDGVPFTVVGVLPPEFFGTETGRSFDVAVPIGCEPLMKGRDTAFDRRSDWWLTVMLRLKPGQTLDEATGRLRAMQPQIRSAAMPPDLAPGYQASFLKQPFELVPATTGFSWLRSRYERPLLILLGVVALVLLVASANIANLQLARGAARRHELSVRVALGATPWRIARQSLVESLTIAAAGGLLGTALAVWGSRTILTQLSAGPTPLFLDLSIDSRILAFTAAVTILTAILFGVAPSLRAARSAPIDALKEHGPSVAGPTGSFSGGLVVVQVALSLVLVVAAGLFVGTFARLASVSLGFDRDPLVVFTVSASKRQPDLPTRIDFYQRLADAAASTPGVADAASSVVTPVSGSSWSMSIEMPGAESLPASDRNAMVNIVTPGWFRAYGTPILAGRDIDRHDVAGSPHVALVNETFVRKFLGRRDPLGATIGFPSVLRDRGVTPRQVVGVVRDAVYRSLREAPRPTMYFPLAQYESFGNPLQMIRVTVRSAGPAPQRLTRSVAAALTAVEPDISFSVRTVGEQIDSSLAQERIVARLSAFFGVLALLLASVGLYGVTAYAVARRRSEIGIRIALGAASSEVIRLVLARVAWLICGGLALGTVASLWLSRFITSLLYGLTPRDPLTFAAAALTFVAVAGFAAAVPAWRAARLDPARVLHET